MLTRLDGQQGLRPLIVFAQLIQTLNLVPCRQVQRVLKDAQFSCPRRVLVDALTIGEQVVVEGVDVEDDLAPVERTVRGLREEQLLVLLVEAARGP